MISHWHKGLLLTSLLNKQSKLVEFELSLIWKGSGEVPIWSIVRKSSYIFNNCCGVF